MTGIKAGCAGIATGWILLCALIAGIFVISAGVWWYGVETSATHGRGEQTKQVNSATNRTYWETHFNTLKSDYESQVAAAHRARQQFAAFSQTYKPGVTSDPTGQLAETYANDQTAATGVEDQCSATARTYNSDSLETQVGARYKPSNLPATLDPNACDKDQ